MTTQSTGILSHTGPQGNTVYWGGKRIEGENRSLAKAGVAVDKGSDGSIDYRAGATRATGPRGTVAAAGYQGPNSAGASAVATNGETAKTWSRHLGSNPLGQKESFDATITGDPHFAVNGSINGQEVSSSFDNQDLGTRTQYGGAGFKLETETVPWGDSGAAVVGSATVTTGFGRGKEQVTVNADGNVSVGGEAVSLQPGQSMDLNRTSSLSMNDDGTYTVSSRNGKVTNTFDVMENANGNYVNVASSVDDVQTVGWMQQQV
ncbi:MAG: hypothetical protein HY319_05180 [Armatimonadetes bacterium]|nr:hypothetical protein [Armatimonadota bacterium]